MLVAVCLTKHDWPVIKPGQVPSMGFCRGAANMTNFPREDELFGVDTRMGYEPPAVPEALAILCRFAV